MGRICRQLNVRFDENLGRLAMAALSLIILCGPCYLRAQGDDLVEMAEDGISGPGDAQTIKRQTLADAIKKVTFKMAADILTEAKVEAMRAGIHSKILPEYEKYIPLIRRGEPVASGEGVKVHFNFKVAPQSLKALLVEEGFLQLSDKPITLLPLTTVSDQTNGTSFIWWFPTPSSIPENEQPQWSTFQKMTARLIDGFARSGIMVLSPATHHMNRWVPDSLRREKLSPDDLPLFAHIMKAQILLTGGITIERPQPGAPSVHVTVHYAAVPLKQDRSIAEVTETEDFPLTEGTALNPDKLNPLLDRATISLVSQVLDVWNRGGINVETIRLVVEGELSAGEFERVKAVVARGSRGVRAIRDRKFQRGIATYELDLAGNAADFATGLGRDSLEGFSTKVLSSSKDEVHLRVSTRH